MSLLNAEGVDKITNKINSLQAIKLCL